MSPIRVPKVLAWSQIEPVSVAEARWHIESQEYGDSTLDDMDDLQIGAMIQAAREDCETFTGRSFVTKTLEIALDAWPTLAADGSVAIPLPGGPVREVLEIRTGALGSSDSSDANVLDPSTYVLDDYAEVPQVRPVSSWPPVTAGALTIKVRYLAGWGEDSDGGEPLPATARAAILLVVGHLYANREDVVRSPLSALPLGAEALLRAHRVTRGFA